jgi:hypothetical protein
MSMTVTAVLAAAAFAGVIGQVPAGPSAEHLEFKGATLGMTLAAWKASPFPGKGFVRPVCSGDAGSGQAGITLSAAERSERARVCTYAYAGPGGPRAEVPIGTGLFARKVRYIFRDDRLAAISYRTTPDAFDAIVARIDAQIGHRSEVTRDQVRVQDGVILPRVRMRWNSAAGDVVLTDPVSSGRMSVVFVAPAFAQTEPVAS